MVDTERLLNNAKKEIKEPDAVVNPKDMTLVWVSEKYANRLGYSPSEIRGKTVFEFSFLPDNKEIRDKIMEDMYSDPCMDEIPLKKKDGGGLIVRIKATKIEFEGRPYVVAKIFGTA